MGGPYERWFFTIPVLRKEIEELHVCGKCGKKKYVKDSILYFNHEDIRKRRPTL